MCSLINKQLLLAAYAYLFIMEQQKGEQGSEALQDCLGKKSRAPQNILPICGAKILQEHRGQNPCAFFKNAHGICRSEKTYKTQEQTCETGYEPISSAEAEQVLGQFRKEKFAKVKDGGTYRTNPLMMVFVRSKKNIVPLGEKFAVSLSKNGEIKNIHSSNTDTEKNYLLCRRSSNQIFAEMKREKDVLTMWTRRRGAIPPFEYVGIKGETFYAAQDNAIKKMDDLVVELRLAELAEFKLFAKNKNDEEQMRKCKNNLANAKVSQQAFLDKLQQLQGQLARLEKQAAEMEIDLKQLAPRQRLEEKVEVLQAATANLNQKVCFYCTLRQADVNKICKACKDNLPEFTACPYKFGEQKKA